MTVATLPPLLSFPSSPPGADEGVAFPLSAMTGDVPGAHGARPAPGGRSSAPHDAHPPAPFSHAPVMVEEIGALFASVPAGLVLDATVGGAGHAAALLRARTDLSLLGLDQDGDAIAAASERLAPFGERVVLQRVRFDELADALAAARRARAGWAELPLVGVLFDLGVSSYQLDEPGRGFSFRYGGPLDMRMDTRQETNAADLVNQWSEQDLARLFAVHGEQRLAYRIARSIVAARPIESTARLADVVAAAVPQAARRRGHPARRVFQALRVEVNAELDVLPRALDRAIDLLAPGGRCVVLAYHSGEDRIVKDRFRHAATGGCVCPPGLPCVCGARPTVALLTRGARRPSAEELARNPRAEAARLRAVERLRDEEVAS